MTTQITKLKIKYDIITNLQINKFDLIKIT